MIRYPAFTLSCRPLSVSKGVPRSRQRLQPFSTTTSIRGPLLNTIRHDHQELGAYYPHIMENKNADERTRYRNLFVWELARHSVAEEMIIYPAIQKHLEDGRDIASKDRDQHQSIKEQLYHLQNLQAEDPDFEPTFRALFSDLRRHVQEEEEHDLPALEAKLDKDALLQLGRSFERTKGFVPTRSHPLSPRAPPFETAAALLSAPVDKLADIFRKFPKEDGPML
ncbi:HHE domain protein [Daldinia bambusicola]|nr:HHE domain protein [Daldinia bambusicola]